MSRWPEKVEEYTAIRAPLYGRAWSGTRSSMWYTRIPKLAKELKAELGSAPIPGSLNLWFITESVFPSARLVNTGSVRWPTAYLQKVILTVDDRHFFRGVAMRPVKKQSRAWLEVFGAVSFRRSLNKLGDNQGVNVWFV